MGKRQSTLRPPRWEKALQVALPARDWFTHFSESLGAPWCLCVFVVKKKLCGLFLEVLIGFNPNETGLPIY
jgi:hypothetical protein